MCSGNENGKIKTLDLIFPTSPRVNLKGKLPKVQGRINNINHYPFYLTAHQPMKTN